MSIADKLSANLIALSQSEPSSGLRGNQSADHVVPQNLRIGGCTQCNRNVKLSRPFCFASVNAIGAGVSRPLYWFSSHEEAGRPHPVTTRSQVTGHESRRLLPQHKFYEHSNEHIPHCLDTGTPRKVSLASERFDKFR
ncbi:unnamed protein product [Pieris brassicae]|uniref:Uncharacterized protein n=1 Tax=Pieris brassicae TaxID=7116 RepID=A0A9P0TSN7_PIEBR|nr:unnamed protein product [Pieris brassicae]